MTNLPHHIDIGPETRSKCDVYNLFGISVMNLKQRPDLRKDAYQSTYQATIPPFGQVTVEWAEGFSSLDLISEYLLHWGPRAHVSLTPDYMVAMATFNCFDITGWMKPADKDIVHDLHLIRVSFAMTSDGNRIIDWVSPI